MVAKPGGCGPLDLVGLTLRAGFENNQLFVALKNTGDVPACSPAFSVELFDHGDQPLAMGLGGLLVRQFYRLADGSDTIAACVAPGDQTMVAITDLPADIAIEDVNRVVYWCNYWTLQVVPIPGLRITNVQRVAHAGGSTYTGALVNELDVPLSSPSVVLFPLNRTGRPLGAAVASAEVEVSLGDSWSFETSSVSDAGVAHAAYPAHGP